MAAFSTITLDNTKTYHVLLKNGVKSSVVNPASISFVDGDFYDASTYSQLVGPNETGNAHVQLSQEKAAQSVPALDIGTETVAGSLKAVVANQPIQAVSDGTLIQATNSGGVPQVVLDGAATTKETTDGSFVFTTTPGKTLKTLTMLYFWSGAGASGNVLAAIPLHKIDMIAPVEPDLIDE